MLYAVPSAYGETSPVYAAPTDTDQYAAEWAASAANSIEYGNGEGGDDRYEELGDGDDGYEELGGGDDGYEELDVATVRSDIFC
jgi:hypothetical protein